MDRFRSLMITVLLSGTLAGLVLFGVRNWTVVPLIEIAETYETAAHEKMPDMVHEDEGWQPTDGLERTSLTALSTILSSIGFAAVLFGIVSVSGRPIDAKRGILWGLAGFACFALAPSLGLPPEPPGVAAADLASRQLWWACTALATAVGLWLITGREQTWLMRLIGLVVLVAPHLIGAPQTDEPPIVPVRLIHEFAIASLATSALFWLVLGWFGGFLSERQAANEA